MAKPKHIKSKLEIEMDNLGFLYEKDTFTNAGGEVAEIIYKFDSLAIGFRNKSTGEVHIFERPISNKK